MAIAIGGRTDKYLKRFARALETYAAEHPKARIDLYRYNPACVRVRVIDPDFKGMSEQERDDLLWGVLDEVPEDIFWHISLLVLLTPEEAKKSWVNYDFEHPLPTPL